MSNLTPLEEAVLESLTTETDKRIKAIEGKVRNISIRYTSSKIDIFSKTKDKPFDSKITIGPPFGFGDICSLYYGIIDVLANDTRVNISDVKKKFTIKLYGEKIIYLNNQTPGVTIYTKMKYRTLVINLNEVDGRNIYNSLFGIIRTIQRRNNKNENKI